MLLFRTPLAAAVAAGVLSGCTPLMKAAVDTVGAAVGSPPALVVSRDAVMARPSFQQRLDSPFGSAVVVLARVEGSEEFWVTSSRQVLVTQNGLIRRTTGFPENLDGSRFVSSPTAPSDPFEAGLHKIAAGMESQREVDWMPGYRYGVRIGSRFQPIGIEEHDILGERHRLLRVDEHFAADGVEFSGINRHWVDPQDGFVFITEQSLLPGLQLRLTQLRPYRSAQR